MQTDFRPFFERLRFFLRPVLGLSVQIQVRNLDQLPTHGGGLLIGNHRSFMDPWVVMSVVERYVHWIGAEYIERLPIFGKLAKKAGVIPIGLDGKASIASLKQIMKYLNQGELIGIFPEGHDYIVRNDFSLPMCDFHAGFAMFALKSRQPIIPFAVIPLEEKLETLALPAPLRAFLGLPAAIDGIQKQALYRTVLVEFGAALQPDEFMHLSAADICSLARQRVENLLRNHGMPVSQPVQAGQKLTASPG